MSLFFQRTGIFLLFLFSAVIPAAAQTADSTRIVTVGEIRITGNRVTKERIIERELTLHAGDTCSYFRFEKKLNRSKENIFNTSLFNFVRVNPVFNADSTRADLSIEVDERWYLWPVPTFEISEQNFNTWWDNGRNLARANYGFILNRDNFRGLRENIGLRVRLGYAPLLAFSYNMPFLNRKQTCGLGFSVSYWRSHELAYETVSNRMLFYKIENGFAREEFSSSATFSWRPRLYTYYGFTARYTDTRVNDTVPAFLNAEYFPEQRNRLSYFSLSARFVRDRRDIRYYAQKGWYTDFDIVRLGLGLLKNETVSITYIQSSYRRYQPLGKRFFAVAMLKGRYEFNRYTSYYHSRAFGFRDMVRGYEYYVIDGQQFALAKAGLRFMLLKPYVRRFRIIPLEKFKTVPLTIFLELFGDGGYVKDNNAAAEKNPLTNRFIYSGGAGLHFVTYYDIVVRTEVAVNAMNQFGFFLHLGAPF